MDPATSRGSLRETVISCFLPFYDGRLRQSSSFPFWRSSFVAYFVKINPKPLQGPLVLPTLALKSWPICMGVGLSAVSPFQAHSHSLALISNCFFIFVCTFKDRDQGESEREKAKVGVKGESRWLLPRPLCVPRPPCWQTTYNVCLQSPLWSRRKGQYTATGRKGDCGGKAGRRLASGGSQGRERIEAISPWDVQG